MIQTIIGFILLISPFLLICKFNDKKIGFAYILSFLITAHLIIAVVTQALQIFTYTSIVVINSIIFIAVAIKTDPKRIFSFKPEQVIKKIDWVLLLVLVIISIHLFSIHYDYSGKITVATSPVYKEVEHMRYTYPYFVDEWYAIAFIESSIDSHSLPFKNPLTGYDCLFINLEFPFHSFLSELILLLNLDPLTDYSILTIFSGLLICVLVYIFLRYEGVNKLPAAIASSSILYITNGANLPGIWNLTPLIMGIISILLSFFFISSGNKKMMFLMAIITSLFYPPLFPFYILAIISSFLTVKELSRKEKARNISYYLMLVAFAGIILSIPYFLVEDSLNNFFHYILFTKIFYPTFIRNAIPQFLIWNIIPTPILVLSALGVFSVIKKKTWLVSILLLGMTYWVLYSFVTFRFIIEYQRVVVFTAILITIAAGFGLSHLIKALKRLDFFQKNNILGYILVGVLILFLVFSPQYTKRDNWQELKLFNFEINKTFLPAAPANNYLHLDDLRLFKNIKNQTFLSLPWKGTVIGIATDNYPITTKAGTITINRKLFSEFMNSDCNKKYEIAKYHSINYIYSPRFNCRNFEFIDRSREGLYLYKLS